MQDIHWIASNAIRMYIWIHPFRPQSIMHVYLIPASVVASEQAGYTANHAIKHLLQQDVWLAVDMFVCLRASRYAIPFQWWKYIAIAMKWMLFAFAFVLLFVIIVAIERATNKQTNIHTISPEAICKLLATRDTCHLLLLSVCWTGNVW